MKDYTKIDLFYILRVLLRSIYLFYSLKYRTRHDNW